MNSNKYIILFLFGFIILLSGCAGTDVTSVQTKLLIAKVQTNVDDINENKVEAAMSIIGLLDKDYKIIPLSTRDSVIRSLKESGTAPTAQLVAEALDANKILFYNIRKLANILRTEISISDAEGNGQTKGTGYAAIRYRHMADETPVYDPALLESMQRAFAVAVNDSFMFAGADENFMVLPAQTVVVGGLDFRDNDSLSKWEIFDKKQINSYEVSETLFDAAKSAKRHVIFDIATRDSIYAMFNLHMVENYRPPTNYEINALKKFEVDYYLTGVINRIEDGASVSVFFTKVEENNLKILDTASGLLRDDSMEELRKLLYKLTGEILDRRDR